MLMEALFERGGLPIHHSVNGIPYVFVRDDYGRFVCNVYSGDHREMLIRTGNFRMAEDMNAVPEDAVPEDAVPEDAVHEDAVPEDAVKDKPKRKRAHV